MKYIKKISSVVMAVLFASSFTACDTEQEGAIYNKQGVTFSSSSLTSVTVSPSDPTFEVDVFRALGEGTLSGEVTITASVDDTPIEGCTVTSFNFSEGETQTTVTVDISPLEIGQELDVTLTLNVDDDLVAVGGTKTTSLTASKDYEWVELGTGTFTDNYFFGTTNEVTIMKAEGFDRWRVVAPYDGYFTNGMPSGLDGFTQSTALVSNLDVWLSDGVVYYNGFGIGLSYTGYGDIYGYHPENFTGASTSYNRFLDDKTIQLAPYYYIPDFGGGFNATSENGVIIITLPE